MKLPYNISIFGESKIDEAILDRYARTLAQIVPYAILPLILLASYRNFVAEPNLVFGSVAIGVWLLIFGFGRLAKRMSPRTILISAPVLFNLLAAITTIRDANVSGALVFIVSSAPFLLLAIGLRKTLGVSALSLAMTSAIYIQSPEADTLFLALNVAMGLSLIFLLTSAVNLLININQTEQKRVNTLLNMVELTTDHSRIALFRHVHKDNQWEANSVYRRMYGIKHEGPIFGFDHIRKAVHPDDLEAVNQSIASSLRVGESLNMTHRVGGDQGYRWVRVSLRLIEEADGKVTYGSVVDVHEAREKQLELDRLQIKSSMATSTFNLGIADGIEAEKELTLDDRALVILGLENSVSNKFSFDHLRSLISEDQQDALTELAAKSRSGSQTDSFRFTLRSADSQVRYIKGAIRRYTDSSQRVHILIVLEDITEAEQNKLALEASASANRELLEQLRLATDEADIRIIEENLSAKTARFITRGKSPRKTAPTYEDRLELVPQDYIEQLKQAYSEPGAIAEYPIVGRVFLTGVEWLRQLYVRKYQRDGEEFALFMVTSITQQKKAQLQLERSFKQLEQSLARLDEIARAGKIGLFDWARESDILRPNAIFREQTGLTEELYPIVSTRNFFELFSDEEGMACFNQLRAAAPDSQAMEYQLKMRLKTGDVRWVRLIASVHQPKGEGAKVSGSLIDLTEHLELEQQLREANNALQRQSRTDPLTQVANRRELDEYLYTQHGMRQRDPHSDFSLLMIDIDYFKDYNDMYGHPLGDKALKCVADLMHKVARRPSDLVARFGGEEFVIVLPDTDAEGALKLARQIQQKLDAEEILHEGSPFKQLTISIGIAALKPEEITTPAELIQLADTALYSAKSLGRNRIELAHQTAKATHPHHSE